MKIYEVTLSSTKSHKDASSRIDDYHFKSSNKNIVKNLRRSGHC